MLQADQLLGKILRLPKRFLPRNILVRILRGPLRGKKWITGAGPEGWWLGISEQEKLRFVSQVIGQGEVFFDVGANVGLYSLLAATKLGPTGRVFAFEPAKRNCDFFTLHMQLNRVQNVDLLPVAIGTHDGAANFDDDGDPVGFRLSDKGKARVEQRSIDSLVQSKELPPPRYLKIDVEGAELQVLEGASATVERNHPDILIETHDRFVSGVHKACRQWLEGRGYEVTEFGSDSPKNEIYAKFLSREI
jgi:FkbM family methyltransferase